MSERASTLVKDAANEPRLGSSPVAVRPYEARLDADKRWGLDEASLYFQDKGSVHKALRKIMQRLDALNIPYAVVGGLALYFHGYRRFTEDVDLLVTSADLDTIHEKLEGLGYVPPFVRSKHLRDVEFGVKIEFLTTGGYPGDGKPKPVAFPSPREYQEIDGVRCLPLFSLIELKLACAMTQPQRVRDFGDVVELIKARNLQKSDADRLNAYVREKYLELWDSVYATHQRFIGFRNEIQIRSDDFADYVVRLRAEADVLAEMLADGVHIVRHDHTGREPALFRLETFDPAVARKYDLQPDTEFRSQDDASDLVQESKETQES